MAHTDESLIADLLATFPGVMARPIAEYKAPGYTEGVWVAGEAEMPDGLPMFSTLHFGEPGFDGGVHTGLTEWIEARGYYLETYDYGTYFALPVNGRLFA